MINELITYLLTTARKHKSVNYIAYARDVNINHQHNNKSYQFIIDSEQLLESTNNEGIMNIKFNVTVMGFKANNVNKLQIQDTSLHILLDWIEYIDNDKTYPNIYVNNYSVVSFDEFTDDNSVGIRATISLTVPSPINLCEYKDNFIEKTTNEIPTIDMNVTDDKCTNSKWDMKTDLTLNPIKLR